MAYIGQQPVVGRYIKIDQISGGFDGTASGFTLAAGGQGVLPGTARNLMLSLGGVIQEPEVDFTVSGSGLTFTTPPVSGTTFFCVIFGDMQSIGQPSDGTVLPASIASSGNFVFPSVSGDTAGFTTVTGTTVTGTTANFVTVSGTTVTGGTAGFTTVTGTTITGTTANVSSGNFNSVDISGGIGSTVTGLTVSGNVFINGSGGIKVPVGATADRPANVTGYIRYNTTSNAFEGYTGNWSPLGGGATGSGGDQVFVETSQTVTASYTLSSGFNAITASPLTVESGVTVTVPSGAAWIVL